MSMIKKVMILTVLALTTVVVFTNATVVRSILGPPQAKADPAQAKADSKHDKTKSAPMIVSLKRPAHSALIRGIAPSRRTAKQQVTATAKVAKSDQVVGKGVVAPLQICSPSWQTGPSAGIATTGIPGVWEVWEESSIACSSGNGQCDGYVILYISDSTAHCDYPIPTGAEIADGCLPFNISCGGNTDTNGYFYLGGLTSGTNYCLNVVLFAGSDCTARNGSTNGANDSYSIKVTAP